MVATMPSQQKTIIKIKKTVTRYLLNNDLIKWKTTPKLVLYDVHKNICEDIVYQKELKMSN